jgi:hypothetical protein
VEVMSTAGARYDHLPGRKRLLRALWIPAIGLTVLINAVVLRYAQAFNRVIHCADTSVATSVRSIAIIFLSGSSAREAPSYPGIPMINAIFAYSSATGKAL